MFLTGDNMYDGSKAYYKNHKVLDNEEIEIAHCKKCNKVTYHKIVYGIDFYGDRLKRIDRFCIRCK